MPDRIIPVIISMIEGMSKYIPYLIGIGVSLTIGAFLLKMVLTAFSLLVAQVVTYFLKPIIIAKIKTWKKKR